MHPLTRAHRTHAHTRAPKIFRSFKGFPFYIETKYDGDRALLHKKGDSYKMFTRSATDYTDKYGGSPAKGSLVPHIHNCFKPSVKDCILDGEVICWDVANDAFAPMGKGVRVSECGLGDGKQPGMQPCLVVFDLVYLNGRNLCKEPLKDRIALLNTIFKDPKVEQKKDPAQTHRDIKRGHLAMGYRMLGQSHEDILKAVLASDARSEEGILLKDLRSTSVVVCGTAVPKSAALPLMPNPFLLPWGRACGEANQKRCST